MQHRRRFDEIRLVANRQISSSSIRLDVLLGSGLFTEPRTSPKQLGLHRKILLLASLRGVFARILLVPDPRPLEEFLSMFQFHPANRRGEAGCEDPRTDRSRVFFTCGLLHFVIGIEGMLSS